MTLFLCRSHRHHLWLLAATVGLAAALVTDMEIGTANSQEVAGGVAVASVTDEAPPELELPRPESLPAVYQTRGQGCVPIEFSKRVAGGSTATIDLHAFRLRRHRDGLPHTSAGSEESESRSRCIRFCIWVV